MKSIFLINSIAVLSALPLSSFAQEDWKFNTAMTGHYADSLTMSNQHGTGFRVTGEHQQQWGLTAGLQSTRIDMKPMTQTTTQDQNNWLLSGYVHVPSTIQPGRWTFQLDAHQVHNDAKVGNSNGVHVIAPQVSWLSSSRPLKLDLGYARSGYRDTPTIHQVSTGLGFGFNNQQNWAFLKHHPL